MRRRFNKRQAMLTAIVLVVAGTVLAEEPWHDYALRVFDGWVENAATIEGRDTYKPLDLGGAEETGLGVAMVLGQNRDIEFSVSRINASGTQLNSIASGNEGNTLHVDLMLTSLQVTGKLRYNKHEGLFVPWMGAGFNVGLIETEETERIQTGAGLVRRPTTGRTSTSVGIHGTAGIDVYAGRSSALALTLETRYKTAVVSGPFDGSTDGFGVSIAVKWDFGPSTH